MGRETEQRFGSLAALYDGRTIRFLEATGVGAGWRCLEIGAGGGSIAAWLADRVGEAGHVTATDIDPRFLTALSALGRPNVEVLRHDVAADPLPEAAYDLVHARLVFIHLPTAGEVLGRVVATLKPGGWLVIEDFDGPLIAERTYAVEDPTDTTTALRAFAALEELRVRRGLAAGWGRGLYRAFRALGLQEAGMEGQVGIHPGGSAGARLFAANFGQIREEAVAAGLIDAAELDRMLALLDDPDFAISTPVMFTAWGRRA
ncbi:MAG: methyltransferase domain-containing protein [Chloroflexia bacterium]